ncbi:MAG: hypothetical protein AAFW83_14825, partial [Pseudomonadota bacterium]
EQFGGAGSPPHLIGLSAWICIDARAGRIEQAEARLEDANSRLPDKRDDPKLAMARVYVDLAKGGSSTSVEDRLSDSSMQTSVKGDAIQYYLYRLLVEDGLAPDLDKAALD